PIPPNTGGQGISGGEHRNGIRGGITSSVGAANNAGIAGNAWITSNGGIMRGDIATISVTGGAPIQPTSGEAIVTTKTYRKRLPLVVRSGSYDAHHQRFCA